MNIEIALAQIFSEVERAEKLHPDWPTSPIHQAGHRNGRSGRAFAGKPEPQ